MTSRLKVQTVYLQIHMQFNRCKQNYIALMYADFVHDWQVRDNLMHIQQYHAY